MRTVPILTLVSLSLACGAGGPSPDPVTADAAGLRTMRVDYFHTGGHGREVFALDEVVVEPAPWPGRVGRPDDPMRYGAYGFDVRDAATGTLVHADGFSSIYGEWIATDEPSRMARTFHESVRFPLPAAPVTVTIRQRVRGDEWRDLWAVTVDPADPFVNRAAPGIDPGAVMPLLENGPSADKVDLLILGDGYTAAERSKFEADARRFVDVLFATSPFRERRADFNVWGLVPAARESGISRPSQGIHRDSPAGTTYDVFGAERYVLTLDNKAFRRLASFAPYDVVEIVVNSRTYGGGGIYNDHSTVAADHTFAPYVFIHEFAHHFAGLADEYYTSPRVIQEATSRPEPPEPNVTALLDPAALKWRDLVEPGTPLPTPWQKDAFEVRSRDIQDRRARLRQENRPETEMEALFTEELRANETAFATEPWAGRVGAFEGALYESRGYYRPELDCLMFSRTMRFCAVCRRAIDRVIDGHVKR